MIKKICIAIILVLVVLIGFTGWYIFNENIQNQEVVDSEPLVKNELSERTLDGLRIMYSEFGNNSFYEEREGELVKDSFIERNFFSYDLQNARQAGIRVDGETQNYVVEVTDEFEQWEVLDDSEDIKADIAMDKNGKYIAYSIANGPETSLVNNWSVVVVDIDLGTRKVIPTAYAPQFVEMDNLTEGGVLFDSTEGLTVFDLSSVSKYTNSNFAKTDVGSRSWVTPDGQYVLIYNNILRKYDVYAFTLADPLLLSPVSQIDSLSLDTLSNKRALSLIGPELYSFDLLTGSRELIYVFDKEELPTKIQLK